MHSTPPFTADAAPGTTTIPHSGATHRMLLYAALDAAGVVLEVGDVQAVFDVAELDRITVQTVITWITVAGRSPVG